MRCMLGFKVSLLSLFIAVSVVGCQESLPSDPAAASLEGVVADGSTTTASATESSAINQQLAALRGATAPFHNFDKADAAGYGVQLTPCLEQLPDGAQGIHYGNPAIIDGTVSLLEPEILLYEPRSNGHLRLVGVEYIVPLSFDQPEPLFGRQFHANEGAGVWALHVWNWRINPHGMFEDWNPKVSCEYAE